MTDTERVEQLCQRWQRLAIKNVAATARRHKTLEPELLSLANLSLFRAARSFVQRGAAFRAKWTFPAWLRIVQWNAVANLVTREAKKRAFAYAGSTNEGLDELPARNGDVGQEAADREELDNAIAIAGELLSILDDTDRTRLLAYIDGGYGTTAKLARAEKCDGKTLKQRALKSLDRLRVAAGVAEAGAAEPYQVAFEGAGR